MMDTRGLTRKDLEPFIGSRARVAEVLNRVRPLSLEMIRRLSTRLGIPAEVLIDPLGFSDGGSGTLHLDPPYRAHETVFKPFVLITTQTGP